MKQFLSILRTSRLRIPQMTLFLVPPTKFNTLQQRSSKLRVLCGNSNPEFAKLVAAHLGTEVIKAKCDKFANGELNIAIDDPVRGDDVFICHPTCANYERNLNVNEAVMELLLLIHTVKLSSAKRITAVIPHFAYARQDRKVCLKNAPFFHMKYDWKVNNASGCVQRK